MSNARWAPGTRRVNSAAWARQRKRILARDNHECQIRGPKCTGQATEVDHMSPWVPGETVPDSSLQAACKPCNAGLGAPEGRNPDVPLPGWLEP